MRRSSRCSIRELKEILVAPSRGVPVVPKDHIDMVHPGIYIGDQEAANNLRLLKELQIGYLLNAAYDQSWSSPLSSKRPDFYTKNGIEFMGITAYDTVSFPIENYFDVAADFIEKAQQSGQSILVHCRQGISRSAALVLAYLILKQNYTLQEALTQVRYHREIYPNDGFLRQLSFLNNSMSYRRSYY